jgi:hypothetical protein
MRSPRCADARTSAVACVHTCQVPKSAPFPQVHQAHPSHEPSFRLVNDEEEILHLVCCRDDAWEVAFCGEPSDHINVNGNTVCTLCVEVAQQHRPGFNVFADPPVCPMDGDQCPDEHDIDLRILREVSP